MNTFLRLVVGFFYDRCPPYCYTKKWHAVAYFSPIDRRLVMVAWPLHYAVRGFRWVEWKWDRYRHKPGWLERYAEAAINEHNNRPRFYR